MKKKKTVKNIQIKKIMIIFGLIVLFFLSSLFFLKERKNLTLPEKILKDSLSAVNSIILAPFTYFSNDNHDSSLLTNTYISELKDEIEALKALNNIDTALSDFDVLNATVISRELSTWYNIITIDKGSKNGVALNQLVIHENGLLGKVTKVSYFTSEVTLLSGEHNRVSVEIEIDNQKINGILNGYDQKRECYLMESSEVLEQNMVGNIVSTNGLGGIYPSGIYVGKVKEVLEEQELGLRKACIESDSTLHDIKYVSVLRKDVKIDED